MILFSDGTQCVPNLHTLKQSTEIKQATILSITSIEIVFKLEKKSLKIVLWTDWRIKEQKVIMYFLCMFVCVPKHSTAAKTIILFKMIAEKIIFFQKKSVLLT